MIQFIKGDFRNVRQALEQLVGKKIPIGIFVIYYVTMTLLILPFAPIIWLVYKIKLRRLIKELESCSKM